MVAISLQQPVIVTQNSNTVTVNEPLAVPQQEKPLNSQDNSVSASQATQAATNQQAPQPTDPTQAVSQTEQQLQRAAVEASATTTPDNREANQQANVETRQTENRQQVAENSTVETPAPPPVESQTSTLANNTAAVSTYQQVGNLGSEQPRRTESASSDTSGNTASSPDQPTSQTTSTSSTSDTQEASPERQVFGGAIDAPRQQAG
ncbi:hypothetical protein A9Q81_02515 [Gammaproteobacteria bacterium 42_54_T18]|nr:hypothetical protein A9Q81_02515 [Gammaproteobacteria bacterium 42_54_T18]